MVNNIVSENKHSLKEKTPGEKSKKRAEELKAAHPTSKGSYKSLTSHKDTTSLSEEEKAAREAAIVEELNRNYAVIHTSSTYILVEKEKNEFILDSKTSLLAWYENQIVSDIFGKEKGKSLTKAHVWLKSPQRRTFSNIVFNPQISGNYDGNFNIWKGFPVEPIEGDCSLFWDHVKYVICTGKESHYNYVRKWVAHLFQKPWIVATALVLRGKQGTGKGTFVTTIGKLLEPHYAPLATLIKF